MSQHRCVCPNCGLSHRQKGWKQKQRREERVAARNLAILQWFAANPKRTYQDAGVKFRVSGFRASQIIKREAARHPDIVVAPRDRKRPFKSRARSLTGADRQRFPVGSAWDIVWVSGEMFAEGAEVRRYTRCFIVVSYRYCDWRNHWREETMYALPRYLKPPSEKVSPEGIDEAKLVSA